MITKERTAVNSYMKPNHSASISNMYKQANVVGTNAGRAQNMPINISSAQVLSPVHVNESKYCLFPLNEDAASKIEEGSSKLIKHPKKMLTWLGKYFEAGNTSHQSANEAAYDLIAMIACFFSVHFLYLGHLNLSSPRTLAFFVALLSLVLFLFIGGAYSQTKNERFGKEISILAFGWFAAFTCVGLFAFLTKTADDISRVWLTISMVSTLVLLALARVISRIRFVESANKNARNIVICGYEADIDRIVRTLRGNGIANINISGIFEFENSENYIVDTRKRLKLFGKPISNYIENQRAAGIPVEQVWVAVPSNKSDIIDQVVASLHDSSVDVCVVPDTYAEKLLEGDTTVIGDTNIVNISEVSLPPAADRFKRVFDFLFASILLLILLVPMALIALIIKLDSRGPSLFRQKRYGVDGREFDVYKFRTMRAHSDDKVMQATRNDTRVTSVGGFLRKSSLDELPQLLNVLEGSMSLVGPRPHAVVHNEEWRTKISGYMLRHKVRPGITGLAQVNGWRGETETAFKMRQRVKYDLKYIKEWTPWLDIQILFLTVFKGFGGKNAY